jgi:hypothetical protein
MTRRRSRTSTPTACSVNEGRPKPLERQLD